MKRGKKRYRPNDRTGRRRFVGTAIGGLVGLPALLRGQEVDTTKRVVPIDSASRAELTRRIEERRKQLQEKREDTGLEVTPDLPLIYPPALREGSTIGVVAPASGATQSAIRSGVASLKRLGFNVKLGNHLSKGFGYLAARDEVRAEEFMKFVRDPEIDCVMAVRGGYGVMRILSMLDFEEIRANPKVIIGYSDITALVNAVYQKSGMIAFHGPVASSGYDSYSVDSFQRTLMQAAPAGTFEESNEYRGSSFVEARASTIVPGVGTGRLVGGNLSLVSDVMGTPYEIDLEGKILFLEEIAEEPYRVDRMLTQLVLSGQIQKCAGVALGRFRKCEAPRRGGEFRVSLSLEQVIRNTLEPLGIPTVYGLSIGHISQKLTVPVGGLAQLDADKKTITLMEASVSAAE